MYLNRVLSLLESSGTLGMMVYYNFFRDFVWTYATYDDVGYSLRYDDRWNDENYAQWMYGTLGMIFAMFLHAFLCWIMQRQMPFLIVVVIILSASFAIPGWNIAGRWGSKIGQNNLGLSSINAGYFAGIFTGLAEGPIQELTDTLFNFLYDVYKRNETKENFSDNFSPKSVFKRFLFSLFIGCIPGDVWQLVYTAGFEYNIGPQGTGLLVALGVGISNVGYGVAKAKFFAPSATDDNDNSQNIKVPLLVIQKTDFELTG